MLPAQGGQKLRKVANCSRLAQLFPTFLRKLLMSKVLFMGQVKPYARQACFGRIIYKRWNFVALV